MYILAGGRSSRFGTDKARAVLDGQPLIARVAAALEPIAARITVVADRPRKYDDLGLTTIADAITGKGPLGGLNTAVADLRESESWLVLASCDLLKVEPAWVASLWANRRQSPAVAFKTDQWHPMPGLYHRRIAGEVSRRITAHRLAMQDLLEAVAATAAPRPADWPDIIQANTPEDLALFRSRR